MARSEESAAKQNTQTGQSLENADTAQSNSILGNLLPTFESQAAHPPGFAPNDLAAMNTAAQQSAGGSESAAVGAGNLAAARTGNAGAFAPAMEASAQDAGKQLSNAAVGIQGKDAMLKEQQRDMALKSMMGLFDTTSGNGLAALGASNGAINAGTNAAGQTTSEWMGPLEAVLGGASKVGAAQLGA